MPSTLRRFHNFRNISFPVDNFGTVVGENPTPYGILALWAVNGLSIVYWVVHYTTTVTCINHFGNSFKMVASYLSIFYFVLS